MCFTRSTNQRVLTRGSAHARDTQWRFLGGLRVASPCCLQSHCVLYVRMDAFTLRARACVWKTKRAK